jgi:hypothetical protein
VRENGHEWIDDNYEYYDSFDDAYDDLENDDYVSGNMSGRATHHSDALAHEVIWDEDFQEHLKCMGTDIADVISRGEETVYVYACLWAADNLYSDFESYWNDKSWENA